MTKDESKFCNEFSRFLMHRACMALSASQVGNFIRVVGVKNRSRKKCTIMVNPVVIKSSKSMVTKEERCLLGDGNYIIANVERPKWVRVEYDEPSLNKRCKTTFRGRLAAAACHVIDLTNGKPIK